MDELSEGTTHEEKLESRSASWTVQEKGNTTLLITHNHELVDRTSSRGSLGAAGGV